MLKYDIYFNMPSTQSHRGQFKASFLKNLKRAQCWVGKHRERTVGKEVHLPENYPKQIDVEDAGNGCRKTGDRLGRPLLCLFERQSLIAPRTGHGKYGDCQTRICSLPDKRIIAIPLKAIIPETHEHKMRMNPFV
jgi:hypothetical protein